MFGLAVLVVSVAALDSLNPSTVGPALVLGAVAPHSPRRVGAFAVGVFAVSTAGGLVLLVGPGRALLSQLAKPSAHAEHVASLVCGGVLLLVAAFLWSRRNRPSKQAVRKVGRSTHSALLLGGGIMAVELPTAVPYVAVLVAIAAARRALVEGVLLVLLYNTVFVLPLVAVLVLDVVAGERADRRMLDVRLRMERRAPTVIPIVVAGVAMLLIAFGAGAF